MNHEHGKADVVVGVLVVHDPAPVERNEGTGASDLLGGEREGRSNLGTREKNHPSRAGRAPRKVHGLVAQDLDLHRVVVQAVLPKDLHRSNHRLPRGLVDVEQIPAEEDAVDFLLFRYFEYLPERDERVVLADLILLVHAEMVVRRDEDPEEVRVIGVRHLEGSCGRANRAERLDPRFFFTTRSPVKFRRE